MALLMDAKYSELNEQQIKALKKLLEESLQREICQDEELHEKETKEGLSFKTPMQFTPTMTATPSPSRDELWKKQLGFDDDSEGSLSNTDDEPEADQDLTGKASLVEVHALQAEIQQKEKQREELLIKLKALSDKAANYRSKLQKSEHSKKSQIKIMKKTQESQLQMKAELIHNLEEMIEEQESKISELEARIKGENISAATPNAKGSSIRKLVDSINELHSEKSRIYETWLSTQSELETVKQENSEAIEKLKWEMSELESQNRKLQVQNVKLQNGDMDVVNDNDNSPKVDQLEQENAELKQKVESLEQEVRTITKANKAAHAKMEGDFMELKKKLRDTETKYTNLASTPPKVRTVSVVSEETQRQLEEMIKQNKELENLLGRTRTELNAKISAIQSEVKSANASASEAQLKEQKLMSECHKLKESLKQAHKLEDSIRQRDEGLEVLKKEVHDLQRELEHSQRKARREREQLEAEAQQRVEDERERAAKGSRVMKTKLESTRLQAKVLMKAVEQVKRQYKDLKIESLKMGTAVKPAIKDIEKQLLKRVEGIDSRNKILVDKYKKEMALRKKYLNELIELKGNIRVYCRVRPVIREDGAGKPAENVISFDDDDDAILNVFSRGALKPFEMDRVFQPQSTQVEVFEEVKPLVISCVDGYNVCIFAYGQTGSGKTFTMEGPVSNPGINQRALQHLFTETADRGVDWDYQVTVSVMEIYNEMLRDLLSSDPSAKLDIKQGKEGLYVPGLSEVEVTNLDEVNEIFQLGKQNRATAFTDMNEHSSRSHALLCATVIGVNRTTGARTIGKLNLVDLAGSERVSKSGSEGARMKEAQNINKSLSSLGDVIHNLKNKSAHVPYRNSKLTYLLQESLGGDSKTLMVVQVAPVEKNVGETVCSLNFAQRVRAVELGQATRKTDNADGGQLKANGMSSGNGSSTPSKLKPSSLPRPRGK